MAKVIVSKKIRLFFKTPDVLDVINEEVDVRDEDGNTILDIESEQFDTLEKEETIQVIKDKLERWIKYGEQLIVVYDTEKNTLTIEDP